MLDHAGGMLRLLLLLVASLLAAVQSTWADDATVLPRGVARAFVDARASLPITQRFTASGWTTDLAADFNRDLNRTVFADLGRLEQAFGLPAGTATFGRSVVEFTRYTQSITLQAAYGLTDRLSVGVRVPYFTQQVEVDAALDARTATLGINPSVPGGVAPLRVPGTRPPTTEDVQAALGRLGFARVEDWRDASFGDSFGGVKYQYLRSEHWRLAVTGSVRFPTGRWDDPNNLVDVSNGFNAWGLGIQFHQDWVWQPPSLARRLGIPTPGTFFLNTDGRPARGLGADVHAHQPRARRGGPGIPDCRGGRTGDRRSGLARDVQLLHAARHGAPPGTAGRPPERAHGCGARW